MKESNTKKKLQKKKNNSYDINCSNQPNFKIVNKIQRSVMETGEVNKPNVINSLLVVKTIISLYSHFYRYLFFCYVSE